MIDRRAALVGMWSLVGQVLTSTGKTIELPFAPQSLMVDLNQWKEFRFTYQGETLVITPAEMFAAIKGKP